MEKVANKLCYADLKEGRLKWYYKYNKTFVFLADNKDRFNDITKVLNLFGNKNRYVIIFTNSNELTDKLFEFITEYNSITEDSLLINLVIREN